MEVSDVAYDLPDRGVVTPIRRSRSQEETDALDRAKRKHPSRRGTPPPPKTGYGDHNNSDLPDQHYNCPFCATQAKTLHHPSCPVAKHYTDPEGNHVYRMGFIGTV